MSDTSASRNYGGIDQLLAESGLGDDAGLRSSLMELRMLADERPRASAQVEALMVPAVSAADSSPEASSPEAAGPRVDSITDELAARRRVKRRLALTTFSVAVSLAAGGAAAAASDQGVRDSVGHVNQAITSFVSAFISGPGANPADRPAPSSPEPVTTGSAGGSATPAPAAPSPAPGPAKATSTPPGGGEASKRPAPEVSRVVRVPWTPLPGQAGAGVPGTGQPMAPDLDLPTGTGPVQVLPVPDPTVTEPPVQLPHPVP
ncbi:hypothetical protein V3C33_17015 [Micrococcaceae bacterium Sec5.7]